MHIQKKWVGALFSLIFTLWLAGCSSGGGDGDAPAVPAGTAEGLWTGTTGDGRTIMGAVLDDGTYWLLYSAVGNPALVADALQGGGSAQNGAFTSSNGRDFSDELLEINTVTVTARYVMRQGLSGTLTYQSRGASTFTSTFAHEYDGVPDIARVAGTYPGSVFGSPYTITVSPSGVITVTTQGGARVSLAGIQLGCDFTGALSPRPHGNVYDISFAPSNNVILCTPETLTGVAFFDAATNKIYVLALNSSRSRVFPFTGTKL